jgi:general transcription factor 3C polypeptide 5 (transcription factor C subunit 1)
MTPTVRVDDDIPLPQFLYLPPPVFMRNYKYEPGYIQKRIFSSQQKETTKLWRDRCDWLVNQNDLMALEHGPRPPPRRKDVTDAMLAIFREMFEDRPIWTSLAIYDHLVTVAETRANVLDINEANASIFHALACVAYHVRTGPFKMCWVRYGINPLLDDRYKMYQVVIVSLREWDYAEDLLRMIENRGCGHGFSKRVGATPIGVSKSDSFPDRLFFGLQLLDLDHPLIGQILAQSQERYSFTSGWFTRQQIDNVRDFLMVKYKRMMTGPDGDRNAAILMADVISLVQIQRELGAAKPKKAVGEVFDFQLMAEVQSILGIFETTTESLQELADLVTKKACAISVDRVLSY